MPDPIEVSSALRRRRSFMLSGVSTTLLDTRRRILRPAFSLSIPGARVFRGLFSRFQYGISSRRRRPPFSGGSYGGGPRVPARLVGTAAAAMSGAHGGATRAEGEGPTRVLLLISDTGGGHRASADALSAAFHELYPGRVDTQIVDFWTEIAGRPLISSG
eukprot:IDg12179t1